MEKGSRIPVLYRNWATYESSICTYQTAQLQWWQGNAGVMRGRDDDSLE